MPNLPDLLKRANANASTERKSPVHQTGESCGRQSHCPSAFQVGAQILAAGLMPIIEPEVDIYCPKRAEAESLLKQAILVKPTVWMPLDKSCSNSDPDENDPL